MSEHHVCITCPACLSALADDGATLDRLSKSFDGTEREWSPAERYQLFARGTATAPRPARCVTPGSGRTTLGTPRVANP